MKQNYLLYTILLFVLNTQAQKNIDQKFDSIYTTLKSTNFKDIDTKQILGFIGKVNYPKSSKKTLEYISKKTLIVNTKQLVDIYYALGNYHFFNSNLDSTLFYLKKTEPYIKELNLPILEASIITTKAAVYQREGNVINANHYFLESLKLFEQVDTLSLTPKDKIKLKGKKMILYNSLAIFNKNTKNYIKANSYYTKAYNMANNLNNKRIAAIILSNQGDLLLKTKDFDKALQILEKSKKLKILADHKNINSINLTNLNIALANIELKNYEKALSILNKIIPSFKTNKSSSNYMYAKTARGQLFNKTKQYNNAITDCFTAYNDATKQKNIEYQKQASKCLSKAYKNIGSYKKAYFFQNKYQQFNDSIFNSDNVKKITQMQMQYDFDKQNELKEITKKAKAKENKLIINSLIFGLIGLLLFSGLIYRLYANRKKNNLILTSKNQQISKAFSDNEVLLKETHHRVKNSLQMISSLLYLQSENIEDEKAAASVKDGQIRVKSMALIHQKLYQNDNLTGIEVSDYINDLAESIFQSHNINNDDIELKISADKMILDIDTITPIGIIINELIVNSLKHAFTNKKKNALIEISLNKEKNFLILKVIDNGKGFEDKNRKEKSFGMKLIKSLSRKLKADLIINNKNGTEVILKIKRFTVK